MTLSKKLFFLVMAFLPISLGKHFEQNFSYIHGVLVDHLVPTVFFLDLLLVLFFVVWVFELINSGTFVSTFVSLKKKLSSFLSLKIAFLFFSFTVVSALVSMQFLSFYYLLRFFLIFLYFIYTVLYFNIPEDLKTFKKIFTYVVLIVSLWGITQFLLQHSIFNNYLVLGEQPITLSTFNATRDTFFTVSKILPYATFQHPNILAGYITICLLFLIFTRDIELTDISRFLFPFSVVLGVLVLVLTRSEVSLVAFVLVVSIGYLPFLRKYKAKILYYLSVLVLFLGVFAFFFSNSGFVSFYRRGSLLMSSLNILRDNELFGVGPLQSIVLIRDSLISLNYPQFLQPVHNIFVLTLVELGVFSTLFFVSLLTHLSRFFSRNTSRSDYLFSSLIFTLIFIGSFDHYFYTIISTQLLFWLTLGVCLKYNFNNES